MERLEKKKAGSSFDVIKPRDVVIELTPEYRRKLAERFVKAHNDHLLDRTGQPDTRIGDYDKTDRFENLKGILQMKRLPKMIFLLGLLKVALSRKALALWVKRCYK